MPARSKRSLATRNRNRDSSGKILPGLEIVLEEVQLEMVEEAAVESDEDEDYIQEFTLADNVHQGTKNPASPAIC